MRQLLDEIARLHHFKLHDVRALSGGDINQVFQLKAPSESFVIKINSALSFPNMFEAEAAGLQLLESTNSFKIPNVIGHGIVGTHSYLLMEYIPPHARGKTFAWDFAHCLVNLHNVSHSNFGLDHSNYIGSLYQQNEWCTTAADFYISRRLEPQFALAANNGFYFGDLSKFYRTISMVIPEERPSLIHGDLWNGNYLIAKEGKPVLIDPAVSYGIREMDLAMMHLFGGFSEEVYNVYHELSPLQAGWQDRTSLWQLYYLLVHLNLFGSGYLSQVQTAIKRYL